jgi:voltage-gated potassium channel
MKKSRFFNLIGMGGVAEHEPAIARRWSRRFEIALFPVALFALLAWYDNKRGQALMGHEYHALFDWLLWLFFVTELITMLCLVRQRWHYLSYNWFSLALIIVAMPVLWNEQEFGILRTLRFFLVIMKLANLSQTIRAVLSRNNLGLTIMAVWLFTVFAGVMMSAIEPSFQNLSDGLWWAWVTVTTVGYGDVVPETNGGRVLAGLVMLIGMGLFSLITASFSAFFIAKEERKIVRKEDEVLEKEVQVLVGEQRILHHLQQIEKRIEALEQRLPPGDGSKT